MRPKLNGTNHRHHRRLRSSMSDPTTPSGRVEGSGITSPLKLKSFTLKVPRLDDAPNPYSLNSVDPIRPWNAGPDRSMVAPLPTADPISLMKLSTLERKAKEVGPCGETCPVYVKLVKSIACPEEGVRVKVK